MRKHLKTMLVASTLTAALAAAPAIYAHDSDRAGGSMMENCSQMMQAMMGDRHEPARPNEQWRDRLPQQPDQSR